MNIFIIINLFINELAIIYFVLNFLFQRSKQNPLGDLDEDEDKNESSRYVLYCNYLVLTLWLKTPNFILLNHK